MQSLNLPGFDYKLREEDGKRFIYDVFRKKHVVLTPEEWVRQHFIHWLTGHLHYPGGLITVEASLRYLNLKKRADAIVYGKSGKPLMILEFKAPTVNITQDVFDQIARYNYGLGVQYLGVTNGMYHYCCKFDTQAESWKFLEKFPDFRQISE